MTRPNRILAATDLSAPARHAAARAAMLAAETGAELELLHVIETGVLADLHRLFGERADELDSRLKDQARDVLRQLAAELGAAHGPGIGASVTDGAVLAAIGERADAMNASLVVLGARGANYMRHWLLGATAERLLRKIRQPILVVRQTPHGAYRSALVPVDFSAWSLEAIRQAQAVAQGARLTLLHVYQVPFEANLHLAGVEEEQIQAYRMAAQQQAYNRLHALAAEAGLDSGRHRTLVVHGDAAPRILEQAEEQDADLIVMGKQGIGAFEALLLGSVTKHILTEAHCDVLVTQR